MPVTMKDVAKDLGVSVVTISKVLRNHDDISKKMRERVLQRIKELGYRPNLNARSLITGRSSLIGLVVPDLLHPFFAQIAKSLAAGLRTQGYYLLICSTDEDPQMESEEIEHLIGRRLDALVIASSGADVALLKSIQDQKVPLVLLDRQIRGLSSHFVGTNDHAIGVIATEHLIQQGCKRIAHIRGGLNVSTAQKRLDGYKEALKKHGIPFDPENVAELATTDTDSEKSGEQAMSVLLKKKNRPDGVFCFSDPVAVGAMRAIEAANLKVPKDVAVVGCGNLHYDENLRIPLTSVDQESGKIGEKAAKLVLDLLATEEVVSYKRSISSPQLIVRESSRRK